MVCQVLMQATSLISSSATTRENSPSSPSDLHFKAEQLAILITSAKALWHAM